MTGNYDMINEDLNTYIHYDKWGKVSSVVYETERGVDIEIKVVKQDCGFIIKDKSLTQYLKCRLGFHEYKHSICFHCGSEMRDYSY